MMSKAQIQTAIDDYFGRSCPWYRSRKGNLTRRWDGNLILTVFPRPTGGYGWCVNNPLEGVAFSEGTFESEGDAVQDVEERLR